jgi:hypothetical protein
MPLFHTPKSRWAAAAAHLALSILLIGTIALVAFQQLFPAGLHLAAKLDKLLGIMLGVDIVAGPLLTLILYRPGKRGLKLDLAVIAILQLAFLGYGLSTLWKSRPLFLVGSQQAFALVFANEVPDDAADKARARHWPRFQGSGPWLVAVDLSGDVAKDEFLFGYLGGTIGPLGDTDLFVSYAGLRQQILDKARAVGKELPTNGRDPATLKSLALLSARSRTTVMLLDAGSGEPVQAVSTEAAKKTP